MRLAEPLSRKIPSTSVATGSCQHNQCIATACILTLLLQKDTTLGNNHRHIAIYEALAVLIRQRDGNVGIFDALLQRDAKDLSACGR